SQASMLLGAGGDDGDYDTGEFYRPRSWCGAVSLRCRRGRGAGEHRGRRSPANRHQKSLVGWVPGGRAPRRGLDHGVRYTRGGATTYQTIAGFGASEAFGQASAVMNASSSVQQQVLADLYSPTTGAGLTILRNEIGADPGNSIEPNNPGGPNATPNYLSLSQT